MTFKFKETDGFIQVTTLNLSVYGAMGKVPNSLFETAKDLNGCLEVGKVRNEPKYHRWFLAAFSKMPFADVTFAQGYDGEVSLMACMYKKNAGLMDEIMKKSSFSAEKYKPEMTPATLQAAAVWQKAYEQLSISKPKGIPVSSMFANACYSSFLQRYTDVPLSNIESILLNSIKPFGRN